MLICCYSSNSTSTPPPMSSLIQLLVTLKVHLVGQNFSHFRASLLHGNAARIQRFDIIFEKDLSPAFRIIFRIENRMIFVAFRPKNCFDPYCKFLPSENWCTITHRHYSLFNVTIDAFNWLSQQLFILPVMLQVFSLDHFQVVLPKLIIWVKISWDHPQEIFNHFRGLETDKIFC